MNSFDIKAQTYNNYARTEQFINNELFKLIDNTIYDTVLEIGCGTGLFTKLLLARAKKLIAIDSSPNMLAIARNSLKNFARVSLLHLDADEIQLINKRNFDLVVSSSTLNYLAYPDIFAYKIFQLLKENAKLIFNVFTKNTYKELRNILQEMGISLKEPILYDVDYWSEVLRLASFSNIKHTRKTMKIYKPSSYHIIRLINKSGNKLLKQDNTSLSPREIKTLIKLYNEKYTNKLGVSATIDILFFSAKKILN